MTYSSKKQAPADTQTLWDMLQTMRPANSKAENAFIKKYLDSIKGMKKDSYGNRYIRIGTAPIAWSCHTDTVHKESGSQRITYNKNRGTISLSKFEAKASCLGADDTAGVWLMLELIKRKKEGLYIFHRAEEIGGLGSDYIANKTPELVAGIQAMIALDRKGTDSIITHQMGGRCSSDAFAASIADQLAGFRSDSTGSFTDSANYMALVPECTNLSVGYEAAHSPQESLDYFHLLALRDSLLELDYSKLIIDRTPATDDYSDDYWPPYSGKWIRS
ncbi:MAG: M28 family peptidase, partial [Methylocystaceae bacterium]|nr:M28 family peptidase [Methylocystaceae bacterium]